MSELEFGDLAFGPVPETSDPHVAKPAFEDLPDDPFSAASDEIRRSYARTAIGVKTKVYNLSDAAGALEYSELKAQSIRDMYEMKGFNPQKKIQIIREETMFMPTSGSYLCAITWAEYEGEPPPEEEDGISELPETPPKKDAVVKEVPDA